MKVLKKDEMKAALKNRRSAETWKVTIIRRLMETPEGLTDVEIYRATRPDRLEISEQKMIHNVASQMTYIGNDELAIIEKVGEKRVLRAISEEAAKMVGMK